MKVRKLLAMAVSVVMGITMLTGCGSGGSTDTNAKEETESPAGTTETADADGSEGKESNAGDYKIAWCSPDNADESMEFMTKCFREYAEEVGVELISFDGQSDVQKQTDQIANAISQGCDAVMLNPVDNTAMIPAMQKARDAGLVCLTVDTNLADSGKDAYDAFIGPDDLDAGKKAAEIMKELLPDGGKIVEVMGMAGSDPQIKRHDGFAEGIEGSNLEVVESQASPWSTAECMTITEDFLSKYSGIDGIYCHWDNGAVGVVEALKAAGRLDEVVIVSVDGCQKGLDMVLAGDTQATVGRSFKDSSHLYLDGAIALLDGKEMDQINYTEYTIFTKENAADFHPGW